MRNRDVGLDEGEGGILMFNVCANDADVIAEPYEEIDDGVEIVPFEADGMQAPVGIHFVIADCAYAPREVCSSSNARHHPKSLILVLGPGRCDAVDGQNAKVAEINLPGPNSTRLLRSTQIGAIQGGRIGFYTRDRNATTNAAERARISSHSLLWIT